LAKYSTSREGSVSASPGSPRAITACAAHASSKPTTPTIASAISV
jgi:hypothetical protein